MALDEGFATAEEPGDHAKGWKECRCNTEASFGVLHGEVLSSKSGKA